jgi:hypothetical protein
MKKTLVLVLVCALSVIVSTGAMAAVNSGEADFVNYATGRQVDTGGFGGWYYIEPESAFFNANVQSVKDEPNVKDRTDFNSIFYLNDFTFAEIGTKANALDGTDDITYLRGSYKFDNGIFAGLDVNSKSDNYTVVTAGYAYALGENGYIALSGDYDTSKKADWWLGYGINYRYYTDKMRTYGQIYRPYGGSDVGEEAYIADLNLAYKLTDNFVAGVGVNYNDFKDSKDYTNANIGGTYTKDALVVDGRYNSNYDSTTDSNKSMYELMGMYGFTDKITAGVYYANDETLTKKDIYAVKAKYALTDDTQIRLSYQFKNDDLGDVAYLGYNKTF